MSRPVIARIRRVLEDMLDPDSDRWELILDLEKLEAELAETNEEVPPGLADRFLDLYADLHFFEPNPAQRRKESSYFGEEELVNLVTSFLQHLDECGYGQESMGQDEEDAARKEDVSWSLRLEGRDTDPGLLGCLGELFEGARFRPQDVAYDPEEGRVTVVLIRSWERDRGRWKALRWRMRSGMPRKRASLVFRGVTSCEEELRSGDRGACLAALSGVDIGPERAYLRSVEEIHRLPVYEVRVAYGRLDVEIVEEGAVLEE